MARGVSRGDIWLHRFAPPDKRRPVVVLSRDDALEVLRSVIVAPVTSTIRSLPSEVLIDAGHGLKHPSAINLDHVQTVQRDDLKRYVATLPIEVMSRVCGALAVATGCS
jgi:mRNA interferase MazF